MTTYTTHRMSHSMSAPAPIRLKLSTRYTPLSHPLSPTSSSSSLSAASASSYYATTSDRQYSLNYSPITSSSATSRTTSPTSLSSAASALLVVLDHLVSSQVSQLCDPSSGASSSTQRIPESFFLDTFHVFKHSSSSSSGSSSSSRSSSSKHARSSTAPLAHFPRDAQSYVAARNELVRAGCVRWVRKRGELLIDELDLRYARAQQMQMQSGAGLDDEDERGRATLRRLAEGAAEVGLHW